jgi:hypothetical protein
MNYYKCEAISKDEQWLDHKANTADEQHILDDCLKSPVNSDACIMVIYSGLENHCNVWQF